MLGQDDMDPGQMTDDQVAADPRSYTAKSVPQRMAIISAGVIMNLITAGCFSATPITRGRGSRRSGRRSCCGGMPAWTHGIRPGDTLTKINGRKVREYSDVIRGVALSSGTLEIEAKRPGGEKYSITIDPDADGIAVDWESIRLRHSRSMPVRFRSPLPDHPPRSPASRQAMRSSPSTEKP